MTTNYVWDINRRIPVILQDGDNTYVYGLGLVSTTDGSGNQTYRMTDGLGSTVGLCDGSGNMVATYIYDAFGGIRSQTGSSSNYWLFTGEQRDPESGFDYLRARYYDSEIGRFLGQDAAAPDWKSPETLNRFSYALNSPLVLVDPTGLSAVSGVMTTTDEYGEYVVIHYTCDYGFCIDDATGYVLSVYSDPENAMQCYKNEACSLSSGLYISDYAGPDGIILFYQGCTRYDAMFNCTEALVCYTLCETRYGEAATNACRAAYCGPTPYNIPSIGGVTNPVLETYGCSTSYGANYACQMFDRALRISGNGREVNIGSGASLPNLCGSLYTCQYRNY